MNQRSGRSALAASAAVVAILALGACSGSDDKKPSTTSTTSKTKPTVVTKTSNAPATSNYVGARKDVTDITCKQDGKLWKVSGKVTNPTEAAANYRIFTSFLDQANETRGLLQTDVPNVAAHQAKEWSGELELDAKDLHCGLRVERTGINGAPPPTEAPTSTSGP